MHNSGLVGRWALAHTGALTRENMVLSDKLSIAFIRYIIPFLFDLFMLFTRKSDLTCFFLVLYLDLKINENDSFLVSGFF